MRGRKLQVELRRDAPQRSILRAEVHSIRWAACLAVFSIALTRPAVADDCGRPNLKASFPPDGASSVPLNATLSASYAESAEYLNEPVTLTSDTAERSLSARFDSSERRLIVDAPGLDPDTHYTLAWPALRGISTAGHGSTKSVSFTTGDTPDATPPAFEGITRLDWDLVHPRDECTDDLEPRLRFDFIFGAASDDGGTDSLELLLFQSKGGALPGDAPRFVASRALPSKSRTTVDLTVADATGDVCFAAMVRDLVGNVSPTGSDTHCIRTTAPPIFYGCSIGGGPTEPAPGAALAVAVFAALLGRRYRRSR